MEGAAGNFGSGLGNGSTGSNQATYAPPGRKFQEMRNLSNSPHQGKVETHALANVSTLALSAFVLGLIHYVFIRIPGNESLALVSSVFLCFAVAFILAERYDLEKGAILTPILLFMLWYFYFQARFDTPFLISFAAVVAAVMFAPTLFGKQDFTKSASYAFIPILFLFLDIGFLPFLLEQLNLPITNLLQNLILYMPWWSFLALFLIPEEVIHSRLLSTTVSFVKIFGIIYIFIVILGPTVPQFGRDIQTLPGAEQFQEAQQRFETQAAAETPENPLISTVKCLGEGQLSTLSVCQSEKQLLSKLQKRCNNNLPGATTEALAACVEEQQQLELEEQEAAQGQVNRELAPLTVQITPEDRFRSLQTIEYLPGSEELISLFAHVDVQNDRGVEVPLRFSCTFVSGRGESVAGVVSPETATVRRTGRTTFSCQAPSSAQFESGNYQVLLAAEADLETTAYLELAFVAEESLADPFIESKEREFFSRGAYSQSPDDPVMLSFWLGSEGEALVPVENPAFFQASLQSQGGRITSLDSYYFSTQDLGFIVQSGRDACLNGDQRDLVSGLDTKNYNPVVSLPSCLLSVPESIVSRVAQERFVVERIDASVAYSYEVESQAGIRIERIDASADSEVLV